MSEELESSYLDETAETLLEQSQQNAQALILATISMLGELGIKSDVWADAIGQRFSDAWGDDDIWEPSEFLDTMLTNYRSLGAIIEEVEFSETTATATISGYPDEELVEVFGVTLEEARVYHQVSAIIASRRGLSWQWTIDDDLTTIVVSPSASPKPAE